MDCLGRWEKFLHHRESPPLVQIALAHYQFEAIHPFLDGNGRVGRLLITLTLVEREVLPTPLLYLSAFFEATRREYYAGLREVSERSSWESWIQYVLNGIARQAEDALSRAERINQLLSRWRAALSGTGTGVPLRMLDLLAANPYVTVKRAAERMKVAFTTAQRSVDRLQKAGVLSQISKAKRDRVYCARPILEILEEPARLVPTENA
jgi:Fic family protein